MNVALIIVLALLIVLAVLFVGGVAANRRRYRVGSEAYERHVAEADRALEEARAADRGWDRSVLEEAARSGLAAERPGESYESLHVVLVDDRPGVAEDRAELMATGTDGRSCRLSLAREPGGSWVVERVE